MTLWLRVRRTGACVATILAIAVALALFSDLYLPLPDLFSGPGLAVPLALLIPLAVAIVVAWGLTTGAPLLEAVASRPLRLLDTAYALSVATLALAVCAVVAAMAITDLGLAAGRNAVGYVGLVLVGRHLLGPHAAPLLPAGFVLVASLFGTGADRLPRWWAWPLAGSGDTASWGIAVMLLILGAAATLTRNSVGSSER